MAKKSLTIEEAFESLDEILEKLEDRDITLENSFQMYHKGIDLLKYCNDKIDTVEKQMLQIDDNGELNEF
ncbi:exodeoxyribonuclease VII small subunit [Konateibacter massiliensis]|uniref:exodeoxyribonuclease VII small subunit n=1 Tax=Konateibacter massiliensis TaxID=2002841 RepID=UPI000C15A6E7|nr:exodeoxyribonuclease VII small subunit [Konateibacter massiliensis]